MTNFIKVIDNTFGNKLCDDLIAYYTNNEQIGEPQEWADLDRERVSNVRCNDILLRPNSEKSIDLISRCRNGFQKLVQDYTEEVYSFTSQIDVGLSLRKIHGATRRHSDGVYCADHLGDVYERKLSVIVGLNNDFEGGEFYFPLQDFRTQVKRGQAICFPPYYTHPHEVSAPTNGYRYTINTWLIEVPPRKIYTVHKPSVHPSGDA